MIKIKGYINHNLVDLVIETRSMTEAQAAQEGKNVGIFITSAYTELIGQAPSLLATDTKHLPTLTKAVNKLVKAAEKPA